MIWVLLDTKLLLFDRHIHYAVNTALKKLGFIIRLTKKKF